MGIITAKKLWYDGEIAKGNCDANLNCDIFTGTTPRDAWLVPIYGCCNTSTYSLSLSMPNPMPAGTLQGVWIETKDGKGMMLNAISAQAVVTACNACCGESTVVEPRYSGPLPVAPPLVAATYTFTRADNNDWYSFRKASEGYWPEYISGTFNRTSYNTGTGVSTYTLQAYQMPIWMAGDTLASKTAKVFTSNAAPTLASGEELVLMVVADGEYITPNLTGATINALQTAAAGNSAYSALGTWAVASNTLTLTTSTNINTPTPNQVQITISKQKTP